MKNYIRRSPHVNLLRRNVKLESGGMYLLHSEVSANSQYIQNKETIRYAKNIFRKHLKGIMDILYFHSTSGGLGVLVKVKDEDLIKEEWVFRGKREMEISVIISEVVRYSLSAIAKFRNRKSGRKGSLVRENFRTFVMRSYTSMRKLIEEMRGNKILMSGQGDGFRKEGGVFDFWSCGGNMITKDVLRKLIKTTLISTKPKNHTHFNYLPSTT